MQDNHKNTWPIGIFIQTFYQTLDEQNLKLRLKEEKCSLINQDECKNLEYSLITKFGPQNRKSTHDNKMNI